MSGRALYAKVSDEEFDRLPVKVRDLFDQWAKPGSDGSCVAPEKIETVPINGSVLVVPSPHSWRTDDYISWTTEDDPTRWTEDKGLAYYEARMAEIWARKP